MMINILRGLPGSGKTTWARAMEKRRTAAGRGATVIYSADDFHVKGGPDGGKPEYQFDPAQAKNAHGWCLRRFLDTVRTHEGSAHDCLVVVDNTNTTPYEIAPYYALGEAYSHEVRIVQFTCTPAEALARNVHGVPEATIALMYKRLTAADLPPWWRLYEPGPV